MRTPIALGLLVFSGFASAADDKAAGPRPQRFAIVFNMGYGGDHLPKENAQFEALVKSIKAAHFNVILGQYTPERDKICQRYGLQMFVDLLVDDHHVYKNIAGAKTLCTSLKGNETIYGYHIWSDLITKPTTAGRTRDIKAVHEWDPTHPVYVGTKTMNGISSVEGMNLFGYYDFHWKRGGHWTHLTKAAELSRQRQIPFLRYDDATSGIVGKGNINRVGYTYATSIPFGLKGIIYHYTGGIVDPKTWKLDPLGEDLKQVNARLASAGDEIVKLGTPIATYSGSITKTEKNEPTQFPAAIPAGLTAVPVKHWYQLAAGEVLVGEFRDPDHRDVLVFATHNPYEAQQVKLTFPTKVKSAQFFQRSTQKWQDLPVREDTINFGVEEAAVELVRIVR